MNDLICGRNNNHHKIKTKTLTKMARRFSHLTDREKDIKHNVNIMWLGILAMLLVKLKPVHPYASLVVNKYSEGN